MIYPTEFGLPVAPRELELPRSRLPERRNSYNNHHSIWPARKMGKMAITQTLRDLEAYQDVLPIDVHDNLHRDYEPPEIDVHEAFQRVMLAYELEERLRLGSARHPVYRQIPEERMLRIKNEYNRLDTPRTVVDLGAVA